MGLSLECVSLAIRKRLTGFAYISPTQRNVCVEDCSILST